MLLTSCLHEDYDDKQQPDGNGRTLPVTLSFASNLLPPTDETRAVGDPGEGDLFEMPKYVYLYVFGWSTPDKTGTPVMLQPTVGNPVRLSTSSENWSVNANGNIYSYNQTIDILVGDANSFRSGEAYVVASVEELPEIAPTGTNLYTDLKGKTFDFPNNCFTSTEMTGGTAPDAAKAQVNRNHFLKNLYSSPINLFYEWGNNSYTVENGEYKIVTRDALNAQYYGTVLDAGSKIPHVSMVLYHVAGRLDVMWDVKKDASGHEQTAKRVNYIEVNNMRSKGCKIFEPTENVAVGDGNYSTAGGYGETFLKDGTPDTYWQGRSVRYVIQQKGSSDATGYNVPFTGKMRYVDTQAGYYMPLNSTIKINTPHRDLFTSWMRGYIEIGE